MDRLAHRGGGQRGFPQAGWHGLPRRFAVLALMLAIGCAACELPEDAAAPGGSPARSDADDPGSALTASGTGATHSFSRPDEVRVTHMEMDWRVLFAEKILDGSVTLHLERGTVAGAVPLRLDTRDLEIETVTADPGEPADWVVEERDPHLGSPLIVHLPADATWVRIDYRTRPEATGLQWLAPEQTAGGKHAFLYSQSQAIHARSFVPCQDTPAVRVTFDASLEVPEPLVATMAAEAVEAADSTAAGDTDAPAVEAGWRRFHFKMPHPIPSYLLALAVGELEFAEVGPRTGVWAEPPLLQPSVHEFADMETMLAAVEKLYGPYRWGRYDLLVLPPSFPFGGMENPTLTFATPTLLAGDRSLVSLVAHEMAHSWSGNLVTNATWSDFWLNEGFTTYLERRIMEEVYGRDRAEMEWMLSRQDLNDEMELFADKPGDQVLHMDLTGRDPDDGMNAIAYDKGSLFLRLLEETYGREAFDSYLNSWFDEHAFTSVTTATFRASLEKNLMDRHSPLSGRTVPDLDLWIEGPGLPETAPVASSATLAAARDAATGWAAGKVATEALETGDWTTHQWLHFLRALPDDLTAARVGELDAAFDLTHVGNNEILDQWLVLCIRGNYEPAYARLEQFLTGQGRRKFLTPLYREMMKTEAGRTMAHDIYARARPLYHAISRRTLDEILEWPGGDPELP